MYSAARSCATGAPCPGPGRSPRSTFSHHLRILREAGLVTKRIQGAKGYAQLRKQDVDHRFPGLLDSILNADAAAQL